MPRDERRARAAEGRDFFLIFNGGTFIERARETQRKVLAALAAAVHAQPPSQLPAAAAAFLSHEHTRDMFAVGGGFPPSSDVGGCFAHAPAGLVLHQLSGRRRRRHRTIFSDEQLAILESTFATNRYPDVALREKLAIQCNLKEERVEVWYKNRRAKERKSVARDSTTIETTPHMPTLAAAGDSGDETRSSGSAPKAWDEASLGGGDLALLPQPPPFQSLPPPPPPPPPIIDINRVHNDNFSLKRPRLALANDDDTGDDENNDAYEPPTLVAQPPPLKRHRTLFVASTGVD